VSAGAAPLRVHRIPFSTNVERVALACAHKGVAVEWVDHLASDRRAIVELSGQPFVPVVETPDGPLADSPAILRWLEDTVPDPPLWPAEPARRAEADVFVEWFNRVWKGPPNEIADALDGGSPDPERIAALGGEMAAALDWFEALLNGRDYLFGDRVTAADFVVFPFLKYAVAIDPSDDEVFHQVLNQHQPLGEGHAKLRAWIELVDALPRIPGI
jgi:glutathione S-transferase